jgi:hypothetical protein
VLHPGESDRCEHQRQRGRLARDRGREIAAVDVDADPLAQLDGLEVGAVGAQRRLRVRAVVGIFEERARNAAARELAQVVDTGDVFQSRSAPDARSSSSR